MSTPDSLERQHTLATAVARYDELRARDALASTAAEAAAERPAEEEPPPQAAPLQKEEALELLALGEVIARKAGYGRQLGVRSARAAGASWSQIGDALGTSKQAAWEAHNRWIDEQAEQHRRTEHTGMDEQEAASARALAADPDE
jgi:hypothetical protein